MRALVTGGAGFIGSHLVKRLLEDGYEVRVIDDLSAPKSWKNLSGSRVAMHIKGDFLKASLIRRQVRWSDVVFHLAVRCLPEGLEHPTSMMMVNDAGTFHLCMACAGAGKKLVYVSSCEVYGVQTRFPIAEDAPLNPTTTYGASKACGELWCRAFASTYGLDYVIVRPFNAIGPNVRSDKYAPSFIRFIQRVREDRPPIIHGDGEQTRDFIHVADLAEGIYLASKESRETFNIARGEESSINQLAEMVASCYNKNLEPIHVEGRPGDIRRFWADVTKAERVLGFKAKKSLEEALTEVVEWYEEIHPVG